MSTPAPKSRDPKDQLPFDAQGDLTDEERVKGAVKMFVRDFGRTAATYMDACVHCGYCAEACHFYLTTEDPKYTPIHKIAPFKKAYRREVGPFAPLMKLLTPEVSIDELEEWQHLIYDSCTLCGRCSMACPMGIDIPALVESARHGMYEAGLVPYRLSQIVENAVKNEGSQSATPAEFIEAIERYREEYGVWMPLDEEEADILLTVSAGQIEEGHAIAEMARILNHTGVSWTLSSKGYEATNFGMLSGFIDLQKKYTLRLVDAALACKAKILLLPECGHAYGATRWKGPTWYGKEFPFEVLHMTEFLGRFVAEGKIKLKAADSKKVTFHDPCQAGRRGGIFDEPRSVLRTLGLEIDELPGGKEYNLCCGGGGGALANFRNKELRKQAFRLKVAQIEQTEAEAIVSACHQCHITFEQGMKSHNWELPFTQLSTLVAEHLDEEAGAAPSAGRKQESP